MKTQTDVRLVLWVSPEEKQLFKLAAIKDARPLPTWSLRALRAAAGLPLVAPTVNNTVPAVVDTDVSVLPAVAPAVASVLPVSAPAAAPSPLQVWTAEKARLRTLRESAMATGDSIAADTALEAIKAHDTKYPA